MSRRKRKADSPARTGNAAAAPSWAGPGPVDPPRPHRALLVASAVALALWIAALLAMVIYWGPS